MLAALVPLALLACQPAPSEPRAGGKNVCEAGKQKLMSLLERLPEQGLGAAIGVELPEASLGGALGGGPILEISRAGVLLEGRPVSGPTDSERAEHLKEALEELVAHAPAESSHSATIYVAASAETNVRTLRKYLTAVPESFELRLLFGAPSLGVETESERSAQELATRLLAEREPIERRKIATAGYRALADCEAIQQAVESVATMPENERWPRLRAALLEAVRSCACDTMQTASLEHLVVAEQRAGSMAFGSIPLSFIRDARCGASMPLRSIAKLLRQIEDFDAEFAGDWQSDALAFDRVVTNERLLNYFCDALPGETLAALQREGATLYWRVAANGPCQGWTFKPLSTGAPMGTWRRQSSRELPGPLALHYWQGAEEIRVYGPASPRSKATDRTRWPCDQNFEMKAVDEHSVTLAEGHWYFSKEACQSAPASEALFGGCVARAASGLVEEPEGEGPPTGKPE